MEMPAQETSAQRFGKGLLKGVVYGALAAVGAALMINVPVIGSVIKDLITGFGGKALLEGGSFVAGGMGSLVAAVAGVGGLVGGFANALTGESRSPRAAVNVELAKAQIKEAALTEIVQEQNRAIEAVMEQQMIAGQPAVRGAHCQAEESRRAAAAMAALSGRQA